MLQPRADSTPPNRDNGTVVTWRNHDGTLAAGEDTYYTVAWQARQRPAGQSGGCCQWIRYVVVADTIQDAKTASDQGFTWDTQLASSSRSSRELQVIHVDSSGNIKSHFRVPYAVVNEVSNDTPPIAQDLWFGKNQFSPDLKLDNGKTKLSDIETKCGAGC